eukprot:gnl/TRDRNA2_/TRDRNA2_173861_c1_seq1.p1 gnl/TRDRNA2_/TRDRNA2_173861_c1~~gnl/TRDRNA2_/TRDRNA2_173861_c1_seq1.p1  ORF type:complete len:223 (-),score=23.25 gnl/TRDRNA2_/TRDRNA2_173861_c1_seq1:221-889(-)
MQIAIVSPTGKEDSLEVQPSDTVSSLNQFVSETLGHEPSVQQLTFGNVLLTCGQTFESVGIAEGAHVNLALAYPHQAGSYSWRGRSKGAGMAEARLLLHDDGHAYHEICELADDMAPEYEMHTGTWSSDGTNIVLKAGAWKTECRDSKGNPKGKGREGDCKGKGKSLTFTPADTHSLIQVHEKKFVRARKYILEESKGKGEGKSKGGYIKGKEGKGKDAADS